MKDIYEHIEGEPDQRRVEFTPAPPTTTRLRVSGIPPMAERLGFRSTEPAQFRESCTTITFAIRPTVWDPLGQAPIFLNPMGVTLAARGVFARLAIWYLRRYVSAICRGEK